MQWTHGQTVDTCPHRKAPVWPRSGGGTPAHRTPAESSSAFENPTTKPTPNALISQTGCLKHGASYWFPFQPKTVSTRNRPVLGVPVSTYPFPLPCQALHMYPLSSMVYELCYLPKGYVQETCIQISRCAPAAVQFKVPQPLFDLSRIARRNKRRGRSNIG